MYKLLLNSQCYRMFLVKKLTNLKFLPVNVPVPSFRDKNIGNLVVVPILECLKTHNIKI
jgi:hypothetical protein